MRESTRLEIQLIFLHLFFGRNFQHFECFDFAKNMAKNIVTDTIFYTKY